MGGHNIIHCIRGKFKKKKCTHIYISSMGNDLIPIYTYVAEFKSPFAVRIFISWIALNPLVFNTLIYIYNHTLI